MTSSLPSFHVFRILSSFLLFPMNLCQVPLPQRRGLLALPTLRAWLAGLPLPPTLPLPNHQPQDSQASDKKSGAHPRGTSALRGWQWL